MSLVRHGAEILNWTKDELAILGKNSPKILPMKRMYHPQSDVGRL